MRLYRRLGHLKMKRIRHGWERKLIMWAANLKPGDVFGACTGFNHIVATVDPHRRTISSRGGWYIDEVRLTDTEGRWHHAPGGGCVSYPYTRPELLATARSYEHIEGWPDIAEFWKGVLASETTDKPFLTEQGLYVGPPRKAYRDLIMPEEPKT